MAIPVRLRKITYVSRGPASGIQYRKVPETGQLLVLRDYRRTALPAEIARYQAAQAQLAAARARAATRQAAEAARIASYAARASEFSDINYVQAMLLAGLAQASGGTIAGFNLAMRKLEQILAARNATVVGSAVSLPTGPPSKGIKDLNERTLKAAQSQVLRSMYEDVKRATRKQKEEAINYVFKVSTALGEGNITSAKEFKAALAAAQVAITETSVRSIFNFYVRQVKLQSAKEVYEAFINEISGIGFKLFVDDTGVFGVVKDIQKSLSSLSYWIAEEANELIYRVLAETFIEAWSSLNEDQFPSEYKLHLLALIYKHRSMKTIKIHGDRVNNWWIVVDFQKLFGDVTDLEGAYHYQAMTGATIGGINREDGTQVGGSQVGDRVWQLPYRGQPLRHSKMVRYRYWYSMWMNTGEYKMYSPAGGTSRKEHSDLMKDRIEAMQRRKIKRSKKWNDYAATTEDSQLQIGLNRLKYQSDMDYLGRMEDYARKYRTTEPRKLNPNARQNTINARLRYWKIKGVAPYWYFLEYGQLRYPPTIPPRGVYGKFIINLRAEIEMLAKTTFNKELARHSGIMVDMQGRRRVSARALPGEEQIYYTHAINPKTKRKKRIGKSGNPPPGSFLPNTQLFTRTVSAAKRTVSEAEAFGKIVTGANQRLSAQEAEFNDFLASVGAWTNPTTRSRDTPMGVMDVNGPTGKGYYMDYLMQQPPVPIKRAGVGTTISNSSYASTGGVNPNSWLGRQQARLREAPRRRAVPTMPPAVNKQGKVIKRRKPIIPHG